MTTTTTRRKWTPAELTLLRQRYPAEGPTALASELGRTPGAVALRAYQMGLTTRRAVDVRRARALWERGRNTVQIARQLRCTPSGVQKALNRAGVDTTRRQDGTASAGWQRVFREHGYRSLTQRREEKRAYLALLSWPGCGPLTAGERRVLDALERHGEQDGADLATACGLRCRAPGRAPGWFSCRLHSLLDRGLLAREVRQRRAYWSLAGPAAEAARRRRVQEDLR
jgi:hypothetical protein